MIYYPAAIVAVDPERVVARLETTGQEIVFKHVEFVLVPPEERKVGIKGFISFPKAPPMFTREAA